MDKTYTFVDLIWTAYVTQNKTDIRYCTVVAISSLLLTFRPLFDEEVSETDGEETEDGTALLSNPDDSSDDDADDDNY